MSMATQNTRPAALTSRVAVYPSEALRPIPSFVFTIPTGWELDEAPQTLAVLRAPTEVEEFAVNAVIAHERVAAGADHKAVAQSTWAQLLRECPDSKVVMEKMVTFGDRKTYLRAVELQVPRSGRALAQLQALFFAPSPEGAKSLDFFQIIGSCPPEVAEEYGPSFLEVIGSLRFT